MHQDRGCLCLTERRLVEDTGWWCSVAGSLGQQGKYARERVVCRRPSKAGKEVCPPCPDTSTLSPRQDSSRSIWAATGPVLRSLLPALPDLVGSRVVHGREFRPSDGEIALASFCCKGAVATALLSLIFLPSSRNWSLLLVSRVIQERHTHSFGWRMPYFCNTVQD